MAVKDFQKGKPSFNFPDVTLPLGDTSVDKHILSPRSNSVGNGNRTRVAFGGETHLQPPSFSFFPYAFSSSLTKEFASVAVQVQLEVRRILWVGEVGRGWTKHLRSNQPKDFLVLFRFFVPDSGSFSLWGIRPPPTFCNADRWRGWKEKDIKTGTWRTDQKVAN